MLVVLLVAAKTRQRGVAKTAQIFMAGCALDGRSGMRIAQRKFCPVMIEAPGRGLPVAFQVAIRALFAQSGVVFVVFFVATDAVLRRFLEHRALVAIFAFHLGVLAQKRKTTLIVVEAGRFLPTALTVATATILAQ